MPRSARLFLCARCRVQVVLCRQCDRGQIYCGPECSAQSRSERCREARQRYAQGRAGRHGNAARQHRFRQRQRAAHNNQDEIVTDQGSAPALPVATLAPDPVRTGVNPVSAAMCRSAHHRCSRCAAHCSALLRQGFLRPEQRRSRDPPS